MRARGQAVCVSEDRQGNIFPFYEGGSTLSDYKIGHRDFLNLTEQDEDDMVFMQALSANLPEPAVGAGALSEPAGADALPEPNADALPEPDASSQGAFSSMYPGGA